MSRELLINGLRVDFDPDDGEEDGLEFIPNVTIISGERSEVEQAINTTFANADESGGEFGCITWTTVARADGAIIHTCYVERLVRVRSDPDAGPAGGKS